MRVTDASEIRQLRLLRGCPDETIESLLAAGFLQRFPRGVVLVREGEPADFLYILIEGLVELYGSNAERETTTSFVRPVGSFILAAVLKDQVNLQSARTLESSRLLMIPAARVREAMARDLRFMSAVVAELATGYRDLVRELKNQKLRTGAERLANWLLRADRRSGGAGLIEIEVEKRALASRLGMTPESLSRAFQSLAAHGVRINGAVVRLDDPEGLARFAKPNPLIDEPDG